MFRVLIPVDGSENSVRAVEWVIATAVLFKEPPEIHLLNVQHPFPGTVRGVHHQAQQDHHDEGLKALASARKVLDDAGARYAYHIGVGDVGETVAQYVKEKKLQQIVLGTRGLGPVTGMLLGSVASRVIGCAEVPVLLVK